MLRLITLDMTNTILKFRKPPGEQYAAVAKLYGLDSDPLKLTQAFRLSFKQLEHEAPNFGVGGIGWQKWWLGVVRRTFTSAGCCADSSSLDTIGHHLIRHFSGGNAYELFEGSTTLLEDIRGRGVVLGAISNSDERLEGILLHLGVRHYFDFVLTSYAAKVAKPDPRIFQQALSCAGNNITSSEALHIGDDLQRDYLAAQRCGWQSVLVSSKLHQVCREAGVTVDDASMVTCLTDLHSLLDRYTTS
ncbi:haloacid dehalogenase-like hydrolase domain-containing protein 3 isoform X1 [Portunus trituberculatus]|uniref:haloacid dehalogenase-like hydrolase domain-containing protein 3 isoform X1 n=1 Tax=Portunus trituberculatus TaxID=210409 RepID=UPI001E1D21F2|nr:haloacid dehalogenase-like hydrolase domain-containing protein 3 isoform X1 [Portunus trituberculatus]XP_045113969.1 haloacid dehalogenase-like hydrolase domain-containing protein 3 isoform X1 [Portunus trituberculatus]XP_045113970.1 haloacid dehalogenase-like hydrolase domain-containing protein 3 isoform X1 [Portunus trituberculatus]XP_045113972.1 haloacid dehalogenase-like hydrolase domain-containing protein 3 isoform X1 [Portunus trituberculatus]